MRFMYELFIPFNGMLSQSVLVARQGHARTSFDFRRRCRVSRVLASSRKRKLLKSQRENSCGFEIICENPGQFCSVRVGAQHFPRKMVIFSVENRMEARTPCELVRMVQIARIRADLSLQIGAKLVQIGADKFRLVAGWCRE